MLDHVFKNNAREDLIQRMNDDENYDEKNKVDESMDKMMNDSTKGLNLLNNTIDVM